MLIQSAGELPQNGVLRVEFSKFSQLNLSGIALNYADRSGSLGLTESTEGHGQCGLITFLVDGVTTKRVWLKKERLSVKYGDFTVRITIKGINYALTMKGIVPRLFLITGAPDGILLTGEISSKVVLEFFEMAQEIITERA